MSSTVARTQLALITAACRPAGEFDISGRGLSDALNCRTIHTHEIGQALIAHLRALVDEAKSHSYAVGDLDDAINQITDAFADIDAALAKAADAEADAREVA